MKELVRITLDSVKNLRVVEYDRDGLRLMDAEAMKQPDWTYFYEIAELYMDEEQIKEETG